MCSINTLLSFHLILLCTFFTTVRAFSTPSYNIFSSLTDVFKPNNINNNESTALVNKVNEEREKLKRNLITLCKDKSINDEEKRKNVVELIMLLKDLNPIEQTASSPLLQKEWLLLWTTEKEINFFIDWNISGQITQTLNNGILNNNIPFQKGGSFGVKGKLSIPEPIDSDTNDVSVNSNMIGVDSNGLRTEFEFETATLDLGKWGTYSFPPIGKGWFDTVYLDDSFRVDVNSRDDILICQSS